jgi:hypothetical protein
VIRSFVAVAVFVAASSAAGETLSLGSIQVEIADGWIHGVEQVTQVDTGVGDRVTIRNPEGVGVLTIQTLAAPENVSGEALRRLTNVDEAQPLSMQVWGDYAGYQHDFLEGDTFYRIWWLARENRLVFATYQCDAELKDFETDAIEQIVLSLRAIAPSA